MQELTRLFINLDNKFSRTNCSEFIYKAFAQLSAAEQLHLFKKLCKYCNHHNPSKEPHRFNMNGFIDFLRSLDSENTNIVNQYLNSLL